MRVCGVRRKRNGKRNLRKTGGPPRGKVLEFIPFRRQSYRVGSATEGRRKEQKQQRKKKNKKRASKKRRGGA